MAERPDLDDDFGGATLSPVWGDHYLPHWTTPHRSHANYDLDGSLRLRIDADQPLWRVDDAPMRVSSLQTADWSGPVGSARGIHPHRPGLRVVTAAERRIGWAPSAGRIEVTVAASTDPGCMTAAWLVGTEHLDPGERAGAGDASSGEICLFEIDAESIGPVSRARSGVKAHRDPGLTTDMAEVEVPLDASQPHTWSARWGAGETVISCEGHVVRRIPQAPDYPLALFIDLFEITPGGRAPKTARFLRVRGWSS